MPSRPPPPRSSPRPREARKSPAKSRPWARPRADAESPEERLTQELLELAFHRAAKVVASGESPLQRSRRTALRKIGRTSGNLLRQLRVATRSFQDLESIGAFRLGLLEQKLGPGELERSLLRIQRAQERLIGLRTEEERSIPRMEEREEIGAAVRRYYGRAASLIREVARDLLRIREAERLLRDRPALEGPSPVVVVAGYPNVGKSSLIGRITHAHPKVAPYPFTTVAVAVGHAKIGPLRQAVIVDTPGMLDRSEGSSNAIEREALLAVRSGGRILVFLLDPSGSCGWPLGDQEALLARLRAVFPDRTFLEVENKVDLERSPSPRRKISCSTGEGVDELMAEISRLLKDADGGLPPLPPIRDAELVPGADRFEPGPMGNGPSTGDLERPARRRRRAPRPDGA